LGDSGEFQLLISALTVYPNYAQVPALEVGSRSTSKEENRKSTYRGGIKEHLVCVMGLKGLEKGTYEKKSVSRIRGRENWIWRPRSKLARGGSRNHTKRLTTNEVTASNYSHSREK